MITFQVNDMTCGHCVGTITQALKAVDQDAKVRIDLQRHLVEIEPGSADAAGLRDAIAQAGYTPVPAATSARSGTEPAQPSGCCCR